jgi:hypothetical protein
MQALLTAIVTWLSANYGLPANYDLAAVRFAAPMEIASIRYGAFGLERSGEAIAAYNSLPADQRHSIVSVYDDKTKTIVLPVGWQGISPAELSELVHEMVHHLQKVADLTYACPQEREALAYIIRLRRNGWVCSDEAFRASSRSIFPPGRSANSSRRSLSRTQTGGNSDLFSQLLTLAASAHRIAPSVTPSHRASVHSY